MEIRKRMVGIPDLKLWQMYHTVKPESDVDQKNGGQHQLNVEVCQPRVRGLKVEQAEDKDSVVMLGGPAGNAKHENVRVHVWPPQAEERNHADSARSSGRPLMYRASNMTTLFAVPRGVVSSAYESIPGGAFCSREPPIDFQTDIAAAMTSLKQQQQHTFCKEVKMEPAADVALGFSGPAEVIAAGEGGCASNLDHLVSETEGVGAENTMSCSESSGGEDVVLPMVLLVKKMESFPPPEILHLSGRKSLCSVKIETGQESPARRALIMVEEGATLVAAEPRPRLASAGKELGPVKMEIVPEPEQNSVTFKALFHGHADLPCPAPSPSGQEAQAVPEVKKESHVEVSKVLMPALDLFPHKARKLEEITGSSHQNHLLHDCGENSLLEAAKLSGGRASDQMTVALRVKREPVVDGPAGIADVNAAAARCCSLGELARLALQGEKTSQLALFKSAVKLELPNSIGNHHHQRLRISNDRRSFQASHMHHPDSDHDYSAASDHEPDSGLAHPPPRLQNNEMAALDGAVGIVGLLSQTLHKVDDACVEKKHRNCNPGRRVHGGRIYDSSFGTTCHWCRQKTVEPHVKCRECTIHFCGPCLLNRNGEKIREELCDGVAWLCPRCRNGCGPGCDNCCNCGPCRKANGRTPTGQLIWAARNTGFENVHDYLVHLETGETPAVIARRKDGREWTNCGRFECEDHAASEESEAPDGVCAHEDAGMESASNVDGSSTQLCGWKSDINHVRRLMMEFHRKHGAMRGAMQAKTAQHNNITVSPAAAAAASIPAGGASILARLNNISGQGSAVRCAIKTDMGHLLLKAEPCGEERAVADNSKQEEKAILIPVCKREFEELGDENRQNGGLECNRAAKKMRPGDTMRGATIPAAGFQGLVGLAAGRCSVRQEMNMSMSHTARGVWDKEATPAGGRVSGDHRRSAPFQEILSSGSSSLLHPFTEPVDRVAANPTSKTELPTCGEDMVDPCTSAENCEHTSTQACPRKHFTTHAVILPHRRSGCDSLYTLRTRGVSIFDGPKEGLSSLPSHSTRCEPHQLECSTFCQGKSYGTKPKASLAAQFDAKELKELTEIAECRNCSQRKCRIVCGRTLRDVVTEDEGLSYLDQYQGFASRLAKATNAPEKLTLLRGFFSWLQATAAAVILRSDVIRDAAGCCQCERESYTHNLLQQPLQSCREIPQPPDRAPTPLLFLLPGNAQNALVQGAEQQPPGMALRQSDPRLLQRIKSRVNKQISRKKLKERRSDVVQSAANNYRVVLCLPVQRTARYN